MVSQSPLIETAKQPAFDPNEMVIEKFANILLPTDEFVTLVRQFPGSNALAYWGAEKGDFFITFTVYVEGKEIGKIHSKHVDQDGLIQADFEELLDFCPGNKTGIIIADYHHSKKVPIELYFANVHKKTGAYVAYPSQGFMGDLICAAAHTVEMENALFWPGAVLNEKTETSFYAINPYRVSTSSQVHLFLPDASRHQSKVLKIKPYNYLKLSVEELFPEYYQQIVDADGRCSIAITSQFKMIAMGMFKDKVSGAVTTIDHLHKYCMT